MIQNGMPQKDKRGWTKLNQCQGQSEKTVVVKAFTRLEISLLVKRKLKRSVWIRA
jgi:hypothetical protein